MSTTIDSYTAVKEVSRIEEVRGHPDRYEVGLGDDASVVLSSSLIADLGLRTGAPVNAELHGRILLFAARLSAYDRALGMLARGPRSMFDLRRRLAAKGEDSAAIAWALAKLESDGIASDDTYAIQFCRSRFARGASRSAVLSGLLRAGVARDVAERAIAQVVSEEGWDEVVASRKAAVKKIRSMSGLDRSTARRRLVSFLKRRGYGMTAVREALDRMNDAGEESAPKDE